MKRFSTTVLAACVLALTACETRALDFEDVPGNVPMWSAGDPFGFASLSNYLAQTQAAALAATNAQATADAAVPQTRTITVNGTTGTLSSNLTFTTATIAQGALADTALQPASTNGWVVSAHGAWITAPDGTNAALAVLASNPSNWVDRAGATQGMQVAGSYLTAIPANETLAAAAARGDFIGTETIRPLRVSCKMFGSSSGASASGTGWGAYGDWAGFGASGNNWSAIGYNSAANCIGDEWCAVGNSSGYGAIWTNSHAFGLRAGYKARGNNRLYIDVIPVYPEAGYSAEAESMIYGDDGDLYLGRTNKTLTVRAQTITIPGYLTTTGDGSSLTNITAAQVGAVSNNAAGIIAAGGLTNIYVAGTAGAITGGVAYVALSFTPLVSALGVTTAEVQNIGGAVRTNFFSDTQLHATGQTATYAVGDDGYYKKGRALKQPRFTINSPGLATNTFTDTSTGLMWPRSVTSLGVTTTNWMGANAACEALSYGGYDDWRLPNIREILSLLDFRFYSPVISGTNGTTKAAAGGDPFYTNPTGDWWVSTEYATATAGSKAWSINLGAGYTYGDVTNNAYKIMPVRGP